MAAQLGHAEMVELLLKARNQNQDINHCRTTDGATPLFMAAQEGHDKVIITLVQARASINEHQNDGGTPTSGRDFKH